MSDAMANNMASPRSARAAALERRQALSHNGSAALGAKPSAPVRMVSNPAATEAAGATGKSLSRARREALSQGGAAGLTQANAAAHAGIRVIAAAMPTPAPAPVETLASATGQAAPTRGDGGCGCKDKDKADVAERGQGNGEKSGAMAELSGRDAARARRKELCQHGRGDQPVCRPSGRERPKPATPTKVEQGTTLSGTTVTGTQVERSVKVTGVEPGSCRAITGTEYIGAEQYGELCAAIPEPAPAKVSVGSTSRGQRVSGVELGRSVKVTGDEHGACRTVTGTEYLSAEKFESFCATKPVPAPAKVGVAATQAGQRVSGTEVGRSAKVTGDEPGSCLKLTGSQYYQPEQFGNPGRGSCSGAPRKVSVMSTLRERSLTGTEIAPDARVTGAERGACVSVTGTESAGLAQYQACNRKPVPAPEKVGVMRTWHEQPVSGTSVERSPKVTGDEYGACQPVSGTEYAGPDQYAAFCESDRQAAARAPMVRRSGAASAAMTGVRPGPDSKVTGAARGERQVLSGTAYSDTDRLVRQHGEVAPSPHPLTRGPADAPRVAVTAPEVADVRGNFSVMSPARSAQGSQLSRVTGTAYGVAGRITGPVNLAAGLVSGTPEFRYRDEAYGAAPAAAAPEVPRSRLTGDGREGGFAITGAAWRRNESITGTEGTSTRRNPTLRGDQRGMVMGASQLKDHERPELPISRITGSSGNDAKGSAITYSGGARG